MNISMNHLDEKEIISWMINYYCLKNHNGTEICATCNDLLVYALKRNEQCPHGENKPVCSLCEIHCYNKSYREKIREVMKYSGPRILLHKPLNGLKYMINKKFGRKNRIKNPSK